jgi:alpha-beta hydrolase superfamily lysophospholipase
VLTFDNRASGRSRRVEEGATGDGGHQTAALLAADAWRLVDHVWGADACVHVYGASMGGMIVQVIQLTTTSEASHARGS